MIIIATWYAFHGGPEIIWSPKVKGNISFVVLCYIIVTYMEIQYIIGYVMVYYSYIYVYNKKNVLKIFVSRIWR